MSIHSKIFPYKKPLLLCALYDTLDKLSLTLSDASSEEGILWVRDRAGKKKFVIRVSQTAEAEVFEVSIETENGAEGGKEIPEDGIRAGHLFYALEEMLLAALNRS